MYYVYVLRSISYADELYIGSTNDLRARFKAHNEAKSISTRRYVPWRLIYYEAYETEKLARMREQKLKHHGNAIRELKKRIGGFIQHHSNGAGFTLMELLIVIAVIGILVSISTVAYSSAQKKTRDTRRKNDLKAIQNAFEQYYADTSNNYPSTCSVSTTYLPNGLPLDPKTGVAYTSTSGWYSCTTAAYCVCAALEGETNALTSCSGGSPPSGYTGFHCVRSVQ